MSWATENKFIAGFGAAVAVGLGGLGYLTYSASGKLDQAQESYLGNSKTLSNLQNQNPFPKAANQKKVEAERDKVIAAYRGLQKTLAGAKMPMAEMTAAAFQSELKRTVDSVLAKASAANIPLNQDGSQNDEKGGAPKIDLGFDYLAQLPEGDAASPLGKQLKVIEWVVNMMIDSKVAGFPDVNRDKLPEELGQKRATTPDKADKANKKTKGESTDPDPGLIERSGFTIKFRAHQNVARNVLNAIAGAKEQFLVIRKLRIVNTSPQAPAKVQTVATPPPGAPPQAPAEAATPAAVTPGEPTPNPPNEAPAENNKKLTFILGEEMVDIEADIEILDFVPPDEATNTAK